ncbi:hypothetical protein [Phaeobacter phage MD18]|nr:hypothetical protein [Phaeobacter phage MD18]
MTGGFARMVEHLRHVAQIGQPGRREEVLVSRRALKALIEDYDRLDADARARHRSEFPEAYPPT